MTRFRLAVAILAFGLMSACSFAVTRYGLSIEISDEEATP